MTDAANPLNQADEAREPTELEVLKERAKKMGINFSNNIGVESLRQKIAEKQEGKGENFNPALSTAPAPAPAASTSLFSLGRTDPTPQTPAAATVAAGAASVEQAPAPVVLVPAAAAPAPHVDTVEELQAKLAALTGASAVPVAEAAVAPVNALTGEAPVKQRSLQQLMRDEQMKLVRLRIQNLDPKKKDLQGEIITVANEYLGTVKKFVPYGEVTDEGFHVPYCIYTFLKGKKFLNIRTTRDRVTRQIKVEHNMVLEYSLEIMPQLTQDEINRLAAAQAAAGSLN